MDIASDRIGEAVEFTITEEHAGERLDKFLAGMLPQVSRTKVQESIKVGLVEINGRPEKKSYPVEPGDEIRFQKVKPPPIGADPEDIPLDIIYEDADLLVVNKPAGMVVHPGHGHRSGTLVNALLHHVQANPIWLEELDDDELDDDEIGLSTYGAIPTREGDPSVRPGIVHRLDKDTSGLLVVAKTNAAHVDLADQFADHSTDRRYLALVWGDPHPREGIINKPIGRDPSNRKQMAVVNSGKPAVTHYKTLETHPHTALVALHLETGRTHQIRVHMQEVGHPVLGDPTYGGQAYRYGAVSRSRRAFFRNLFGEMPRQALHAEKLGFVHPSSGEQMSFSSSLPEDFEHVLARLRRDAEGMQYR